MEVDHIMCGDSLEVLKTFPDECIHLICTSPPYFIHDKAYFQGGDHKSQNVIEEWEKYVVWLCDILYETKRVLVPGGKLVINIDDRHTSLKNAGKNVKLATHAHLIVNLTKFGFDYKSQILWKKIRRSNASGGSHRVLGSYGRFRSPGEIPIIGETEFIQNFRKPGFRKNITDDLRKASALKPEEFSKFGMEVWDDIRPCMGKNKFGHPCPYPVELCERVIKLNTFVGDTVIDIFGGVGSLAVAAKLLNRKYISIDISQEYCDIAQQRLDSLVLDEGK